MSARSGDLARGLALFERASRSIPGGVLGFHKLMAPELYPPFLRSGRGARVDDLDGNSYVDYIMGKGPLVLGYAAPAVLAAVREQLERGALLSSSVELQVEVADALLRWFPAAEQVRFHKSGSEACAAAVRLARVVTGRLTVLSSGYHGWHDWCSPGEPGGSPEHFVDFHYDLDHLERALAERRGRVAAIIVEPIPDFLSPGFYRQLRALADDQGALLVFDEVKTGLRVAGGSVQAAVAVAPDMTAVSKAIANGHCLSCVLGTRDVLQASARTHISTTFDIEALPLAAAAATLQRLAEPGALSRLVAAAGSLAAGLNDCCAALALPIRAFALGSMVRLAFAEPEWEPQFYSQMAAHGVLLYPYDNSFVSLAHGDEETALTLGAARTVLGALRAARRPSLDHAAVAERRLDQFPHRKGFLHHAAGPDGRARP